MKRHVILIGAIICLVSGCNSRSDREKIQGEWLLDGMAGWFKFYLPSEKGGLKVIGFSGDEFTFENAPGPIHTVTGTFACDTTQSPKQITFNFNNRTVVGIYEVTSSSLRICVADEDEDSKTAPTEFVGGALRTGRPRTALLTFKRPPENFVHRKE